MPNIDDHPELLVLKGVSKVFSTPEIQTHALRALDLTVKRGEFVSISGPSGSGKTTLLSLLGLLEQPTTGQYWINGQPSAQLSDRARSRLRRDTIGFVFQNFNLIANMTVLENVELPLVYKRKQDSRRRALLAIEQLGLASRSGHLPSQLSGGQMQRVALARVLASEPEVILADEPTGNLDSEAGLVVLDLLTDLNRLGKTLIIVTHDEDAANRSQRKLYVHDGILLERPSADGYELGVGTC